MPQQPTDPILEELKRINEEFSAKMRELYEQQKALVRRVAARIDAEGAARARRDIENGEQEI